jgi:hypothetical protein
MTLGEFFQMIGQRPQMLLLFYGAVPLTAWVAGLMGRGEGHLSPWKWLYAALVYLASVPGIFAITLTLYFIVIERRGLLETDVFIQILPVFSMIATYLLVRWNVPLARVPGFGKLSGLWMMLFVLLMLLWVLDRTRIILFSFLPLYLALIILIGLIVIFRLGWSISFERK